MKEIYPVRAMLSGQIRHALAALLLGLVPLCAAQQAAPPGAINGVNAGKKALAAGQYVQAKSIFDAVLKEHPDNIAARLGLADSELGLNHYETAETMYREIVAQQPELWQAHKNLVVVEAALGRWEDFDSERAVLRLARERGAPGISARESDVIDSFVVAGRRWVVREYFEPVGRSATRYNFETFAPDGKAEEYISLDGTDAAGLEPDGAVAIGGPQSATATPRHYTLSWLTGKAHGRIRSYGSQEPGYEAVRTDVIRWLHSQAASVPAK